MQMPSMRYSISARKPKSIEIQRIVDYLKMRFNVNVNEIDNFFGFSEYCPLYGGRPFIGEEITHKDLVYMYDRGIGYRIPLTNHLVDYDEYKSQKSFLTKYHREGNSLIIVNDNLAKWVRNDFPKYQLEASIIKRIRTMEQLDRALELYDSVLPEHGSADWAFQIEDLKKIKDKDRIILFGAMGCEWHCHTKRCYLIHSLQNKVLDSEKVYACCREVRMDDGIDRRPRDMRQTYYDLGFHRFKLSFAGTHTNCSKVYYNENILKRA